MFLAFILPVLVYCSPVWMSAAISHLLLLDHVVGRASQLSGGSVSCDLWYRRKVASLCVFFKIDTVWLISCIFPAQYVLRRHIRRALDLLRCQGLKQVSFRVILFCFVLDCGMCCVNLSLLVKAWLLLKLQSVAFFYKIDFSLFLLALRLFLFYLSFSRNLR